MEHKTGLADLCPRWWLGASFSLLAVFLLAPAPARAGCGDHVTALHIRAPIAGDPTAPPAQPVKKHVPCTGPNCSRSPVVPAPVPIVPAAPDAQEWACVLTPENALTKTAFSYTPEDHRERPFSTGSSIYHPPR